MLRVGLFLLLPTLCGAAEVLGVVLDEEGNPVVGVEVNVDVGRARYELAADFDRWLAVETRTATTGADGR